MGLLSDPVTVIIEAALGVSFCSLCCIIRFLSWLTLPSHLNAGLVCTFESYQSVMTPVHP